MNFQALDQYLRGITSNGTVPGLEVAVTREGKTLYHEAIGYTDVEKTRLATKEDLRWIFSCTKVMTCIAAMRLVEEGKLSISDPVSRYLPEYAHLKVKDEKTGEIRDAKETMTIAHLFGMMGGLDYDAKAPGIVAAAAAGGGTREIVAAMIEKPLCFEPGTWFKYSFCHDVLAAVVEVVAGMSFGEYLKRIVFDPLELSDIGFVPSEAQLARFPQMYDYNSATREVVPIPSKNPYAFSPDYEGGGAGIFSTVTAYSKFLATLANGKSPEGYVLLRPETMKIISETDILTPGGHLGMISFWSTRLFGYSWGLCGRIHIDPVTSGAKSPRGEFGWAGAASSYCLIDPVNRVSLMLGTNVLHFTYGYHMLHPRLRDLVYECLAAK